MSGVTVITHPLVQHNLTRLRDRRTQPQEFRRLLGEIASLMIYEATRPLAVRPVNVRRRWNPRAAFNCNVRLSSCPSCAPASACWIPSCNSSRTRSLALSV